MKTTKEIGLLENLMYYIFNICTFGAYFVIKVVIKKALIELEK